MYSTIMRDANVLFLMTILVHSRFNISCKFCFLKLIIVQQIVPVPVHRFLTQKSYIFIRTKANYPFLAWKTFLTYTPLSFLLYISIVFPSPPTLHFYDQHKHISIDF